MWGAVLLRVDAIDQCTQPEEQCSRQRHSDEVRYEENVRVHREQTHDGESKYKTAQSANGT
jgi:hypothetical protein